MGLKLRSCLKLSTCICAFFALWTAYFVLVKGYPQSNVVNNDLCCINPFSKMRRQTDAEKDFSESSVE